MKKYIAFVFSLLLTLGITTCVQAYDEYSKYEAYGLCVASKAMEYDSSFDMNKTVSGVAFSEIMNFWFGTDIRRDTTPTNADAVHALAQYAPKTVSAKHSITEFKDFGFIKKEHRNSYKAMCSAGFLNYEADTLNPNYPLKYSTFFEMLIHFEDELIYRSGFDISEGSVTDSFAEGTSIVIKQNTPTGEKEYKFSRMHSFYVQEDGSVSPYSYNIKRGSSAKFYVVDDSIVFVSLKTPYSSFKKKYDLASAGIYLCNPYDRQIIFTNSKTGDYMVYTYTDDVIVYEEKNKISIDDINNYYTDRICYFVTDKNANTIKYINITR